MGHMDDAELLACERSWRRRCVRDLLAPASWNRGRVLLRATGSRETAADLSPEVFAAALAACGEPVHGSAAGSMIGIARNKLLEVRRRGRVEDATRRRLGMSRIALKDPDLTRVKELAGASSLAPLAALSGLPVAERTAIEALVIDRARLRGHRARARMLVVGRPPAGEPRARAGALAAGCGGGSPMSDYFDRLEKELRGAVVRAAGGRRGGGLRWPGSSRRSRPALPWSSSCWQSR